MDTKRRVVIGSGSSENVAEKSADEQIDFLMSKGNRTEVSRTVIDKMKGIRFYYCKKEVVFNEM